LDIYQINKSIMKIKNIFKAIWVNHLIRLQIFSVMFIIGAVLGTDGVLEIESMVNFWDVIYYIGVIYLVLFAVYWIIRAIINGMCYLIKLKKDK